MPSLRVAVVGSGPSGFYAAEGLLRSGLSVGIDMFERLPVPYGLVRFGVAPDHPKLKLVTAVFDRIASMPGFRFVGGVALVHSDLGTGTAEDAPLTAALIPLLRPLLAGGAVLVANNPFPDAGWELLPLPDGVPAERYFMYRVSA